MMEVTKIQAKVLKAAQDVYDYRVERKRITLKMRECNRKCLGEDMLCRHGSLYKNVEVEKCDYCIEWERLHEKLLSVRYQLQLAYKRLMSAVSSLRHELVTILDDEPF